MRRQPDPYNTITWSLAACQEKESFATENIQAQIISAGGGSARVATNDQGSNLQISNRSDAFA